MTSLNIHEAARWAGLTLPAPQLEVISAAHTAGVNAFLLEGDPGTGKTALGYALGRQAENRGGGFLFAQANAWASDESLIRGIDLAGFVASDPSQVYAPGLLLRAAEMSAQRAGKPVVVLLDEWDKTRPVADGLLLAALEERVVVDAAGVTHAHLGANVIFWITSNASRELHPALRRRLLPQRFDPLRGPALRALLISAGCSSPVAEFFTSRAAAAGWSMTLPDMLRVGRVAPALTSVQACEYLVRPWGISGGDLWAAVRRAPQAGR